MRVFVFVINRNQELINDFLKTLVPYLEVECICNMGKAHTYHAEILAVNVAI